MPAEDEVLTHPVLGQRNEHNLDQTAANPNGVPTPAGPASNAAALIDCSWAGALAI